MRFVGLALLLLASALGTACQSAPNPSFPLTTHDAYQAMQQMAASPAPAARPIVLVGGYGDPGLSTSGIRRRLAPCVKEAQFVLVDPWNAASFDAARKMLVEAVQKQCPCDDPHFTAEVDVVCNSMGGLVALYALDPGAAGPAGGTRTLRAARVFTIASPLRGANAAALPSFDPKVQDMRPGSSFLKRMASAGYSSRCELVPYTRSDDSFVGAANTSLPGTDPWWVPGEFQQSDHMTAHEDPRILADIARRVRGEEPYTHEPRTPLPAARGSS